jgi:hypothetical protein
VNKSDAPKRSLTPLVSPRLPPELAEVERVLTNMVLVINNNNTVQSERWDRIESMLSQLQPPGAGEGSHQLQRIEDMLKEVLAHK